ncbi:MAG: pseudouridine synthase [Bacillota bacterium]
MDRVRLHKFMAACGVASRRAAEKMIADGRVKVNGTVVTTAGYTINPHIDRVELDEKLVQVKKDKQYYLLYKPRGTLTTVSDPFGRRTVMELLERKDVFPVGRLDLDTEGLLLLTDDGELAYRLTHPRFKVKKKYLAWVKGKPSEEKLKLLREGVQLEEGPVSPARVELLAERGGKSILHITIHEGKKRQVKRMCAAIGHPVITLKRVAFAFLTLQGLKPGEYRRLTTEEVKKLLHYAGLPDS